VEFARIPSGPGNLPNSTIQRSSRDKALATILRSGIVALAEAAGSRNQEIPQHNFDVTRVAVTRVLVRTTPTTRDSRRNGMEFPSAPGRAKQRATHKTAIMGNMSSAKFPFARPSSLADDRADD
jgi:hypothetical protein